MKRLKTIRTPTWNKTNFIKKQRRMRKYRRLINIKNRAMLNWLDFKDVVFSLQRKVVSVLRKKIKN